MKGNGKMLAELAKLCGQPLVKLQEDMRRDFYLTAAEAAAYGLIDKVLLPNQVNYTDTYQNFAFAGSYF